jgi:hypothetical protein
MSKPVIALIAMTLVSTAASAYFWEALRTERASTQRLEQRIAQLERPAARPNSTPAPSPVAPESDAAPPVAAASPTQSQPAVARPMVRLGVQPFAIAPSVQGLDPNAQRRFQQAREQQRRMLENPEYRDLMRAQIKLSMHRMDADLEPLLGLTEDESDRLRDLLAEQQLRQMEQEPPPVFDGSQVDESQQREFQERMQAAQRKNNDEVAALLGPKYADWQSYQKNSWSRIQVMQLREGLAQSGDPLRPEQIKPLVEVIAREQQQQQQTQMELMRSYGSHAPAARAQEQWLENTEQMNARIRAAASTVLSPTQLERLAARQDQELKMQQLQLQIQRAREEAQARGELPADSDQTMSTNAGFVSIR